MLQIKCGSNVQKDSSRVVPVVYKWISRAEVPQEISLQRNSVTTRGQNSAAAEAKAERDYGV